jgi:uncharacterized protein (DUF2267 family)
MRKLVRRTLAVGVATASAAALLRPDTSLGRALRRASHRAEQRIRYVRGAAQGARYRLAGRHPDPNASDDVLTQRVRSVLGPLEKRRDLPHVHVMVEDGVALLHGELPTEDDVNTIELRAMEVSGIDSLVSFLHVGLAAGTTRPSAGRSARRARDSDQLQALLRAAEDAGIPEDRARAAVRAVLGAFTERIPEAERRQLLSHLPLDARTLAEPPRHRGGRKRVRTLPDLVASVTEHGYDDMSHAAALIEAVLGRLRTLVPEEANDVAAVLPEELRTLWNNAVPA